MAEQAPIYAATHVGCIRPVNEDRCGTSDWQSRGSNERWQGRIARRGGWVVVADGMGGHGGGEIASGVAVQRMAKLLPAVHSPADVEMSIEVANHAVHEAMFEAGGHPAMGTTLVGVVLHADGCTIFNVGDSRAYVLRDSELKMLSVDHTPDAGGTRTGRSHSLTQSLGGTVSRRKLRPHVVTFATRPGDSLLLCSDGLTDLVDDAEIAIIIRTAAEDPAAALVEAALNAGGRDNVTVAVVEL